MLLRMTDGMGTWVEDVAAQRGIPMATVVRQYIADGLAHDALVFGWEPYVPSPGDEDVPPHAADIAYRIRTLHATGDDGSCVICRIPAPCPTLHITEGTTSS